MAPLNPVPAATATATRRVAAWPALLAALALLVLVPAAPAAAHTTLRSAEPADGSTVESPRQLTLTFSDPVLDLGTEFVVTGPAGPVATDTPVVDGAVVTAALPTDLPAGGYQVSWRVTTQDGHPITGTFAFTATAPAAAPEPAPTTGATTAAATTAPSQQPTATPTTAPVAAEDTAGGSAAPWWWLLGAAALAVAATVVWLNRRRSGTDPR